MVRIVTIIKIMKNGEKKGVAGHPTACSEGGPATLKTVHEWMGTPINSLRVANDPY